MSDVPESSGPIPRRTSRPGNGGAPVSGALAIVLAVIAVVAGFFILRSISDDGDAVADPIVPSGTGGEGDATGDATSDPDQSAVPTLPPTTTAVPLVTQGATVIVANANGVNGSAGTMSRALESGPGFTMGEPTNASATLPDLEETVIYFDATIPAAQAVAESLARVLGGVGSIAPLEGTPPTRDGSLNGAGVLLMLGNDKAGKTLAELAPAPAAPAVTSPAVSGTATTTA